MSEPCKIDRREGARLARIVTPQAKQCYRNSVLALYYAAEGAVYVEGLLRLRAAKALWVPHGWIEVDGYIVDVTLTDQLAGDYHAVFRYPRVAVNDMLELALPYFDNDRATRERIWEAEAELRRRDGRRQPDTSDLQTR